MAVFVCARNISPSALSKFQPSDGMSCTPPAMVAVCREREREREREAERERDVLCHARLFSIFTNTLNVKYAKKIKQSWSASQLLHLAAKVHQRQQRHGKPDRTLATDRSLFARAGRFGNARPIVPLTLCGVSPSFARTRWNCWLPMFALMMFTWRLDRVDHNK